MNKHQPPKLPYRFFRWYCHPDYLEDLEGDLLERFETTRKETGQRDANWQFIKDVLKLFRPGLIRPVGLSDRLINDGMYKNNFKIAYRNILKDKIFAVLNVFGLALGIAACIIIFRYVEFERSYDQFHAHASNIYRISSDLDQGEIRNTAFTPPPLGPQLSQRSQEIIEYTRLILPWSGPSITSTLDWKNDQGKNSKHSFNWGFFTDPGFLNMFSFPLIKGDKDEALNGPFKVVLTESTASKIFGKNWADNSEIVGQNLEYVNEFDRFNLTISGIITDPPENSHFHYDFLASFATLSTGWGKDYAESWDGNNVYTYIQTSPIANIEALADDATSYLQQSHQASAEDKTTLVFQPLTDIYLNSHRDGELKINGNATYVNFFSLIAVVILAVALINYINMTTTKSVSRSQEVGLRKVLGAQRMQLIKQFMFESLLINIVAFLFAVGLLYFSVPYLSSLTGKDINYFSTQTWQFVLILLPLSTILSGLYPAFVLSGYAPVETLKGKLMHSASGNMLRKYLVVFQFWVSIGLILFTFTIYRQLDHMINQEMGFDKEGVLIVNGPVNRTKTWIEHDQGKASQDITSRNEDPFKSTILPYSSIQAVSLSWSVPGEEPSIFPVQLGENYNNATLDVVNADNDFGNVYGLKLLAGEFDTKNGVVINETLANILGFKDPFEAIDMDFKKSNGYGHKIKGVVKDYHHRSLQQDIRPLMYAENDPSYKLDSYYSIKVDLKNLDKTIAQIRTTYQKVYPDNPFDYYFSDDYFDAQYDSDIRFGTLFGTFSLMAIIIAGLGLFGLSIYTVVVKTKEIGIRKVLGASARNIITLLTVNTSKLILLSGLMALPIAYLFTQDWLSDYAFRVELNWLFFLPAFIVPLIVLITISGLSLKAANTNPINTLRNE